MVEGQMPASLLAKLALLAGTRVPRGALLTCSTAPSALVAPSLLEPRAHGEHLCPPVDFPWEFGGHFDRSESLPAQGPPRDSLHCARRSTSLSPEHDPLDGLGGMDTACSQRGLTVSEECPGSCKDGFFHLCRAGWGLYFQLMLHPEEAAHCRWSEIVGFLPALTPKLTSKCFLFSSNNFR